MRLRGNFIFLVPALSVLVMAEWKKVVFFSPGMSFLLLAFEDFRFVWSERRRVRRLGWAGLGCCVFVGVITRSEFCWV